MAVVVVGSLAGGDRQRGDGWAAPWLAVALSRLLYPLGVVRGCGNNMLEEWWSGRFFCGFTSARMALTTNC
jgi:hypothetical protein